jgi:hypothetical protein
MAGAGDGHATCAFREFVTEFDGKRMLTWSKGLKAHFGIAEMDDDQAAEQEGLALNDEHQVGEIAAEQLTVLTKHGKLGEFLAMVAEHGHMPDPQALIDDWINDLALQAGRVRKGTILVDRMIVGPHSYWFQAEEIEA